MVYEGSDASTERNAMMANMFAQYLNRYGTDFSYIRSDPNFGGLSDEQLFSMYREYMESKTVFVNKIGKESKIARIERIVGRSDCGEGLSEHVYRAQVLLDGRKRVQTVVDLQMDDFRLPFLLKDLEIHLKQQLTYIGEIYVMLEKTGAISPRFLEGCVENNCNKSDAAHGSEEVADSLADDVRGHEPVRICSTSEKAAHDMMDLQTPKRSLHDPPSRGGLSNIRNEENADKIPSSGQSEKGMESMVEYPTSENHIDSNAELCSGSIPDSAHSKDEHDRSGYSVRDIVLNAGILTKYDDYLGDFNEDLLEMELPVPKTSTYNPLAPQKEIGAEEVECSTEVSVVSDVEPCDANHQTVQSMKRRCRGRVIVLPKSPPMPGTDPETQSESSNV